MRKKPENGNWYGWDAFEEWADENGVGESEDDWVMWWQCWQTAYKAAINQ